MFAITIADFKNIHAKYGPNRPVVQQEIVCNSLKNSETNGRKIFYRYTYIFNQTSCTFGRTLFWAELLDICVWPSRPQWVLASTPKCLTVDYRTAEWPGLSLATKQRRTAISNSKASEKSKDCVNFILCVIQKQLHFMCTVLQYTSVFS